MTDYMPARSGERAPLTETEARALVNYYRRYLENPYFNPSATPGARQPAAPGGLPGQTLSLEMAGDVFLPPAVRDCIRASGAECLVVVPDGPLHKLPLEGLVLKAGAKPRYVLDDLPPIVYVPSAALLVQLAERPPLPAGPPSLLTVCNPAYRRARPPQRPGAGLPAQFYAQLPLLPFSSVESRRIRAFSPSAGVTVLEGPAATEAAVKADIQGKRIVHLAVHGFADERFGNLYGALVLMPPGPDEKEDGLLTLHEIYRLPLQDCELAVLSACLTNVGPQQPLEAGATLASGFLGAGARRVVASHWRVDDEATAVLMETFFGEVTQAARRKEPIRYAAALQTARRKVRDRWDWSAPFFWAPFVVVGPGDAIK